MSELNETRHCPRLQECESCGRHVELRVVIMSTPAGSLCATLCPSCHQQQALPTGLYSLLAAARVSRHHGHTATRAMLADLARRAGTRAT